MKVFRRCKAILHFTWIALCVMFRNHFFHTKKAITVFKKLFAQYGYKQNRNYID